MEPKGFFNHCLLYFRINIYDVQILNHIRVIRFKSCQGDLLPATASTWPCFTSNIYFRFNSTACFETFESRPARYKIRLGSLLGQSYYNNEQTSPLDPPHLRARCYQLPPIAVRYRRCLPKVERRIPPHHSVRPSPIMNDLVVVLQ